MISVIHLYTHAKHKERSKPNSVVGLKVVLIFFTPLFFKKVKSHMAFLHANYSKKNRSSDLPSLYVSQRPTLPNQSLQTDYLVQPLT